MRLPGTRTDRLLFVLLAALHLAASWWVVVPGHIGVDEMAYDYMSQALATGHGFALQNATEDLPSPELEIQLSQTTFVQGDRLVGKYPIGFPLLAAPLYRLIGYRALFLINALSFVGIWAAIWLLARQFLGDRGYAWLACLLFAPGTYAWEYAQGAWPHGAALLMTTTAALCVTRILAGGDERRWGAAAGLLIGVGLSFRLDVILAAPLLLALLLGPVPGRWRGAAGLALGVLPPLAALSLANQARFGTPSPLSYGAASGMNTAVMARNALLLAGGGGAVLLRLGWPRIPWHRVPRIAWLLPPAALAAALLAAPALRELLWKPLKGLYVLLVDLRQLRTTYIPMDVRGPTGGVLYFGVYKKALLQSSPFLAALLVPAVAAIRGQLGARKLWPLWVFPLGIPVVFAHIQWHGGFCWNLRYFLPILPFAAVLTAWTVRALRRSAAPTWTGIAAAGGLGTAALAAALVWPDAGDIAQAELRLLALPLALSAATAAAALTFGLGAQRLREAAAGPLLLLLAAGVGWSAAVGLLYDLPASRRVRGQSVEVAQLLAPLTAPGDLVLASYEPSFGGLIEQRVDIALPRQDQGADLRRLVQRHLDRGRSVFSALSPGDLNAVLGLGLLEGYEIKSVAPGPSFHLFQITEEYPHNDKEEP